MDVHSSSFLCFDCSNIILNAANPNTTDRELGAPVF